MRSECGEVLRKVCGGRCEEMWVEVSGECGGKVWGR